MSEELGYDPRTEVAPIVDEAEFLSPEILKMYEVSGQDAISPRAVHRYIADSREFESIKSDEFAEIPDEYSEEMAQEERLRRQFSSELSKMPIEKVAQRLIDGLNDSNPHSQEISALLIYEAPPHERLDLYKIAFKSNNYNVLLAAGRAMVRSAEDENSEACDSFESAIYRCFQSSDEELQRKSLSLLWYLPGLSRRYRIMLEVAQNGSIPAQIGCFEIGNPIIQDDFAKIVEIGISSENSEVRDMAAYEISRTGEKHAPALFAKLKERAGDEIVKPALYQGGDPASSRFSRSKFEKTGSETILLGGDLYGKVILRRIEPSRFGIWKELYEDYRLWRDNGFDYVPIEPIISFRSSKKNGTMDVATGVLDLSFDQWKNIGGNFIDELTADSEKLSKILQDKGIEHGHLHDGNFCLRFFRNPDGTVNFERKPRIYVIDFDQASPAESSLP